jgi:hypothetical protein
MTRLRHINCSEAVERAPFFVLGALDPRESAEVKEHLETCSRLHEEFAALGGVVPYLAEEPEPLEPPPALRDRILSAVEADVRARRREGDAAERLVASLGTSVRPAEGVTLDESGAGGSPIGAAAAPEASTADQQATRAPAVLPADGPVDAEGPPLAAVALPASVEPASPDGPRLPDEPATLPPSAASAPTAAYGAAAPTTPAGSAAPARPATQPLPAVPAAGEPVALRGARAAASRRAWTRWALPAAAVLLLVALGGWNLLLQQAASEARQRAQLLAEAVVARSEPNARVALLSGTAGAPQASGSAVMLPGRPGYLVLRGLPPAPSGKTYQAWYLSGGQARSAGLLRVGDDGVAILAGLGFDPAVDAVAVTLENEGGAERPGMAPLVYGPASG